MDMRRSTGGLWLAVACVAAGVGVCVGGAACGGPGRARPEPTLPPTPAAVVTQVKGAVEQWRQGMEVRSVDALATLYAQVPELMHVSQGKVTVGWTATQEALQAFFNAHTEVKVRLSELNVIALGGDGAVASGAIDRRYGDGVTTTEEHGGIVLVFRRTQEGWKIVAEHYSYSPTAQ